VDLATAERLMSAPDPKNLSALKNQGNTPAAAKAVAGQFAALLLQNVMQNSDGTALPIAGDGIGGNIVSGLFASAVSQAATSSGDKFGLADILFHAIEAKQRSAAPGSSKTEMSAPAPPAAQASFRPAQSPGAGHGFPLRPYWQGNGLRPLASTAPTGSTSANSAARSIAGATPKFMGTLPAFVAASAVPTATSGPTRSQPLASDVSGLPAPPRQAQSFVRQLRPILAQAGRQLGVSPSILLAHAALETGWGRAMVGNNLFGIKAGASWQGSQFTTLTHEVEDGERVAREATFRTYPSLDASVQDYVALIGGSPRYQGLIGLGNDAMAYGRGLVAGGYATDPDYGSKLEAVAAEAAAAFATPSEPGPVGPFATISEPGRLELFVTPGSME
jgi:peptidoglycan hydrolase FlgJ